MSEDGIAASWVGGLSAVGIVVCVPVFIVFVRWLRSQQTITGLYAASAFITGRASACSRHPSADDEPTHPPAAINSDSLAPSRSCRPFQAAPGQRDETCVICLEEFGDVVLSELPCLHVAHEQCLDAWFRRDKLHACPICRRPVGTSQSDDGSHLSNDTSSQWDFQQGFQTVALNYWWWWTGFCFMNWVSWPQTGKYRLLKHIWETSQLVLGISVISLCILFYLYVLSCCCFLNEEVAIRFNTPIFMPLLFWQQVDKP